VRPRAPVRKPARGAPKLRRQDLPPWRRLRAGLWRGSADALPLQIQPSAPVT